MINDFPLTDTIHDTPSHPGMILLEANNFALPQRRHRLFILALNTKRAANELVGTPSDILDSALTTFLPIFKTEALPVETSLHLVVVVARDL